MIPTLFPFMVLSGFCVRTGLSNRLSRSLRPFLGWLFPPEPEILYTIIMGFLCGFPMGAKVVADLLSQQKISKLQGEYLLAFCNNIGPLYLMGYVMDLFGWKKSVTVLLVMYGVPLGYGILLQYSKKYRNKLHSLSALPDEAKTVHYAEAQKRQKEIQPVRTMGVVQSFRLSLESGIEQITMLGGCMVFFNCLQIYIRLPGMLLTGAAAHLYEQYLLPILSCLTEIGGGLSLYQSSPLPACYVLCLLTFGGLCCLMQTRFILKETGLSMGNYIRHKIIQSLIMLGLLCLAGKCVR
jgi:hypothetical protein